MKKTFLATIIAAFSFLTACGQDSGKKWLDLNYANDDKEYHKLDIHLPDTEDSIHKAIIVIYGSAWFGNNLKHTAYEAMGKTLQESGFAVVTINHRASSDAPYPAQIHDVKAAIRFIRANATKYYIDPSFIGITGFSSGGHLASMAGATNDVKEFTVGKKTIDVEGTVGDHTSTSSSVDAVVDWFGPIDLALMDACEKPKKGNSPEAAIIKGEPLENLDMIALLSPNTFIDENDAPFMVIHGDADPVVPHCQSELFAEQLKEKGLLTEFITVAGGQHGPVTFNDDTFKKMSAFFLLESNKK
ncbi:alpha/beta hydrolase [Autumnicola psychrophila]|uniref:Alpha/beta hydrolase n=1 Tax=Autumnicola psychrophila TaxID=3075592 RepID=A0ABU3DV36_9FLAO|nr:alpha/beta hydrolase [Zunongwangia sp. F225]MDT0686952.1 alpha/beta hydrolase [Zunongwangia sp. F225]